MPTAPDLSSIINAARRRVEANQNRNRIARKRRSLPGGDAGPKRLPGGGSGGPFRPEQPGVVRPGYTPRRGQPVTGTNGFLPPPPPESRGVISPGGRARLPGAGSGRVFIPEDTAGRARGAIEDFRRIGQGDTSPLNQYRAARRRVSRNRGQGGNNGATDIIRRLQTMRGVR